jgi:hypothetical protein
VPKQIQKENINFHLYASFLQLIYKKSQLGQPLLVII